MSVSWDCLENGRNAYRELDGVPSPDTSAPISQVEEARRRRSQAQGAAPQTRASSQFRSSSITGHDGAGSADEARLPVSTEINGCVRDATYLRRVFQQSN